MRPDLTKTLERLFDQRIGSLVRRPCPYSSSFTIEELDVRLVDGQALKLVWKDLSPTAFLKTARQVKPRFLYDPRREIETYRTILPAAKLGTAQCHGAVVSTAHKRYWLFLENVKGPLLWQVGEFAVWERAAAWLAKLHHEFSAPRQSRLLQYNRDYYRRWMRRARQFARGTARARKIEWLATRHNTLIDQLLALPATFIHGEFYASNILVKGRRICPIDWEMAALGPGLFDVAALTTGQWTPPQRAALAAAYYGTAASAAQLQALDACRMQSAIQWLGWSPVWSPPREHAQDWLREAVELAERLKL